MPKAFLSVNEVADELGLGRSKTYDLIARGDIPSVLLGGRSRRVPRASLDRYIAKLVQAAEGNEYEDPESDRESQRGWR